jgi:ChrR Cupin-like domain
VLDGICNDGIRDYPADTHVHNPAGSSHLPQSRTGCRLFVFYPEGYRVVKYRDIEESAMLMQVGAWCATSRGGFADLPRPWSPSTASSSDGYCAIVVARC